MSKVKVVNLVKKFDKTVAVDGISFDVKDGEFIVLLGPSGCGKTTTLRCIAGLETPDEGEIYIDDKLVNDLPPKDRDVAMVFQSYALYPHMTVYGNLAFPLKMRKLPKDEIDKKVKEVAKLLNIDHLLDRKPRQLSGGEMQRVALGRALVRTPRVFLMDEPLSNLDAKLRVYMRAELKKLQRDLKITTIYVTHDQAEAMAMADRIAVMNKGKILQYSEPHDVYEKPANLFVAGFIGSPPMNFIKASILEKDSKIILDAGFFQYELRRDLGESVKRGASGSEVMIGFRPEHMLLSRERQANSVFQADVYVIEPMGSRIIVDLKAGEYLLKAVAPPTAEIPPPGQKVWVGFSVERLHVFDAKTEKTLI
ncbi:MAG: sugar ABC transporter ATP-binding protein [Candidatus Wolframiiraptor sp. EX4484-121]|nr:MAG: sugar ABC transporter ATP-binding protein [Candidatus Wolframiiraptor sp. EX4484-121]